MHLTVRMAWHDNNWDGKVCQNPVSNTYCTGAHSLLSGRIEKRKILSKKKNVKVNVSMAILIHRMCHHATGLLMPLAPCHFPLIINTLLLL